MTERWKFIGGFPGYEISNLGQVRSCNRTIVTANDQRRTYRGRVLGVAVDGNGYRRVCLWRGNRQYGRIVHRLVVEAFLRKMKKGEQVNHLDCNKQNNRLDNLEITSAEGNAMHAARAGLLAKKLNPQQVLEIKLSLSLGEKPQHLAERFGVSRPAVNAIRWGKTWQHVSVAR